MNAPEPTPETTEALADRPFRRLPDLTAFLLVATAFAWLAATSWRRWPEILVDYGSQLYVPWQLSAGKVLYRDVAYLPGGPLSQYFDALLFRLFEVSFTTLLVANLSLIALFLGLLYWLFRRATDRFTAAVVVLVVLCTFAFAQNGSMGNYNYVCPYSTEAFHGLLLAIAAIACLWRWLVTGRTAPARLAGFFYGGVFLTKPDLFLALSATVAAAVFIRHNQSAIVDRPGGNSWLLLLPGSVLPAVLFLIYYASVGNLPDAFKAVANAWWPLFTSNVADNAYYRWCLGLDAPGALLAAIFYYSAYALVGIAFLAVCARHLKRPSLSAAIVALLLVYALYKTWNPSAWNECGAALLPLTLLGVVLVGRRWWLDRKSPQGAALVFPLLWSVFALFLLAKLGLFTRLRHYGFYLAMPAAAFVVLLLIRLLPGELARFQVDPRIFRILALVFLAWGEGQLVQGSNTYYAAKSFAVGEGGDRMYTLPPEKNILGTSIAQTLAWLKQNTSATNTLAVLPEGVMINYLSRRTNPTPYTVFSLPEVQAYGETNIIAAFAKSPPDYILLVHRNSSEYGVKLFGLEPGYGHDLLHWVRTNYSPLWLLGQEPLKQTNQFGILMLRRKDLPAAAP